MHKRGIYNSMLGVPQIQASADPKSFVLEKVKRLCEITSENIKYVQKNEEMKKRTYVVRYEDIAVKPFEYAKEILDFAGLDYTSEVDNWIVENTQGTTGTLQKYFTARYLRKITSNRDSPQYGYI